jgi:hypothetical protein
MGGQAGAAVSRQLAGPDAGISAGYALCYNRFLMQTGIEASFQYVIGKTASYTDTVPGFDSQADPCIFYLDYTDIHNKMRSLHLAVPLRFGGLWKKFYFALGPAFSLYAVQAKQRTYDLTTTADYGFLIDTFSDMPNHGLSTTRVSGQWTPDPTLFGLDASLEIGWIFSSVKAHRFAPAYDCRLAAYADVGLWRGVNYFPADSFTVGVRLSLWIQIPHHYPCNCISK